MKGEIAFQSCIDTQLIYRHLEAIDMDGIVTYEELSGIIGRDIKKHRGALATARKQLLANKQIFFATVPTVGVQRVNDVKKLEVAGTYVSVVRRAAKRGMRIAAAVEYSSLPKEQQVEHNSTMSHLGVLANISSASAQKKIIKAVIEAHDKLPLARTLDLFKG